MAPVKPSEVEALFVDESSTVCEALQKLIQLSVLIWKWFRWKYTPGGAITDDYRAQICGIECPDA